TVQSDPATSGFVVVQDDETLDPYTGILLSASEEVTAALSRGDVVDITEAMVIENFDVTELDDVTFEVTGSDDPLGYKVVSTAALQDEMVAEAHEGMMVRLEYVQICQSDAGFGEWTFSWGGTEANAVGADG